MRACELITARQAERRVLMLENPSLLGTTFASPTLYAGLQAILPGEIAPTHRHTPNALRFVMEGQGAYTAIDGQRISMRPGDFVVTPGWTKSPGRMRSEEHTSELQSRQNLVCRLLLQKHNEQLTQSCTRSA